MFGSFDSCPKKQKEPKGSSWLCVDMDVIIRHGNVKKLYSGPWYVTIKSLWG